MTGGRVTRVVVTDWDHLDLEIERAVMDRAGVELTVTNCRTEEDVIRACAGADGLLNQYAPLSATVLAWLPRTGGSSTSAAVTMVRR